jgi:Fe-S-cluster containining protein
MAERDWRRLLSFKCSGCGNCCRGTFVPVTDGDVRRMLEGTGRPVTELVRLVKLGDIRMDKRHGWWAKIGDTKAVMALPWRHGHCAYLDAATNRCKIYASRPLVCRSTPLEVHFTDTGAVEKLTRHLVTACPNDWEKGAQSLRALAVLDRLRDRESDAYCEKVAAWNKQKDVKRTPANFYAWLGLTAVPTSQARVAAARRAAAVR